MSILTKIRDYIRKLRKGLWRIFASEVTMEDELINRRDEVIQRAIYAANHQLPESVIDGGFSEICKWIIMPHINEIYTPYSIYNDDRESRALRAVYKILEVVEKEEGDKNE